MNPTHARLMFRIAALFNLGAVLLLVPWPGIGRALGLYPFPKGSLFEYMAIGAVLLFGIGYWIAASAPEQNRTVIQLGLAGKVMVVALALTYYLAGAANLRLIAVTSGDLIFSVLFAWYLISTRTNRASAS